MKAVCRRCSSLTVLIMLYVTVQTAAFAQNERDTLEQREACIPDVFRLCSSEIPDRYRIVVCLRRNESQLSGRCRAVFDDREAIRETTPANGTPR